MTYPYLGEYADSLLAEGEAKGEVKGEAKGEAKALLLVLEGRGIAVSDEVRERVLSCEDKDTLDAWVLRAIAVEKAEALFD
ncbi:hypothetical protein [Nonomuraea sp. NPDC050783]|uniref:hypothetical protein n=1 Tax=Nonomuraea sp. NPDC050783 TaxID=3154634 RepID=UPI0034663C4F